MKSHAARSRVMMSALIAFAFAASARADVIAIGPGAFPGGPQITFTGIPDLVDVNGLVVGGVQFFYSFGSGQVVIDGGPGTTNNIDPQNAVSIGNPTGILTLAFGGLQNIFGFGFAVLNGTPGVNEVLISLFNGATNVGSLFYSGNFDPLFVGGFAGIQSTLAFDRAQVSFNPTVAAFAIDNIRFANVTSTVPEPATLALVLTGLVGIAAFGRRRPRSKTD